MVLSLRGDASGIARTEKKGAKTPVEGAFFRKKKHCKSFMEGSLWPVEARQRSTSVSLQTNAIRSWRGSVLPRFLLAVPDVVALFCSWLMVCQSRTLPTLSVSAVALSTSGQSVFSSTALKVSPTNQAAAIDH